MSVNSYFFIFMGLYAFAIIIYLIRNAKRNQKDYQTYLFGKGNIGLLFSFLGVSATLFSAYAMQGIPTFVRSNGITAWIFFISASLLFVPFMIYVGIKLRMLGSSFHPPKYNVASLLFSTNKSTYITIFYLIVISIFMLPYITVQIKGLSFILNFFFPIFGNSSTFIWSVITLCFILLYSYLGGIRAIYATDALQGSILIIVLCIIAIMSINAAGGISELFATVEKINSQLLSSPGPNSLLTPQFLIMALLWTAVTPIVQPQHTTRILMARSNRVFIITCLGLALFAVVALSAAMIIGLRGVVYSDIKGIGFIMELLINDTAAPIQALFILGVVAASMSTTDSVLFSIGTEWSSFLDRNKKSISLYKVKLVYSVLALVAFILAQLDIQSLVLFAIKTFEGVSFLLPIIVSLFLKKEKDKKLLFAVSFIVITIFLMLTLKIITLAPIFNIRIDLYLYAIIIISLIYIYIKQLFSRAKIVKNLEK